MLKWVLEQVSLIILYMCVNNSAITYTLGAVKITPANDFNDYAIGKRHSLEFINIFTDDGKVNEEGGQFAVCIFFLYFS